MTKSLASILVLVALAAAFAGPPRPAFADIDVRSDVATNRFPDGIQFQFFFASDAAVTDVRLRFRILPDGVNASVRPECTEGAVMNCQAGIGATADAYMVPGAEIVYSWDVTDEDGGRFSTDEQTVTYEDTRFEWEALNEGNLTVYYYFGDEESQRSVLNVAQETIASMSELLDTTVDFPIKIWVYSTAQEMQPAVASRRGRGDDTSIQTLGEVGASDTALVSRDTEFLEIVRHELAHVVTNAATASHLVDIPVWVNEGLSTWSQNELLPGEATALSVAIQRNQVLPITSLGASARGTGSVVSLFYAQSGSIVTYMIDAHGPEKFTEFIKALAQDTPDGALQSVYGFDQIGLENAWREAIGLPEVGSAPAGSNQPPAEPTPASGQSQQPDPTPVRDQPQNVPSGDSDGGSISLLAVAGGLGAVMVLLLPAAGFLAFQSRRQAS